MKKTLTIILILALVLVMGAAITACSAEAPEVGKRAPDFQLNTLDGPDITLSQLKGQPVLVNFWATWCGPCRYEMPFLQQVYEKWPADELVVLTVNVGEGAADVSQFMQSQGFSFTVLLDSQTAVAQKYNIQGIPTTVFIDSDGVIRQIKIGVFQSQAEIENILSKID
jgi:cytochrome c biogenesis protein CcmG/thiol:disulfide interchange protein DsbE